MPGHRITKTRRRDPNPGRRELLRRGLAAGAVLAAGPALWGCAGRGSPRAGAPVDMRRRVSNIPNLAGTLKPTAVDNDPDTTMLVPEGFKVRQVARTGQRPLGHCGYDWHPEPDGGAVFGMPDGGWVYVSNSEVPASGKGGAGALRFNARGEAIGAYPVCARTTNNCAGGPTPWGSWLSCEEFAAGMVYECDPAGHAQAQPLPALGVFKHEAAAVVPETGVIYLTEDQPDGNFYRFITARSRADGKPDLSSGRLEVAIVRGRDPLQSRPITWAELPDPQPAIDTARPERSATPTRCQVPEAQTFDGGEGCWHHRGVVYFTTKGDNRVWAVDTIHATLDLVYDKQSQSAFDPGIDDVDNVTVSPAGEILVAEDGDAMRLVVVGPDVTPFELVDVRGHQGSEITGPAFTPDGSRLYFSSQRGPTGQAGANDGRTYEMRGPFFP